MKLNGLEWQTVKDLLVALWLGVLWFLEWERLIDWIDGVRGVQRDRLGEIHRRARRSQPRGIVVWRQGR